MNITELSLTLMVAIICILGFTAFAVDLTASYDIELPGNLTEAAEDSLSRMNETSNQLMKTISGEEKSWVETLFTVFFALPATAIQTMGDMASTSVSLFGVAVAELGIDIPSWVAPTILVTVSIIVTFVLVAIVFNRSKT